MMGHTVDTYHDIQMKGLEFLRNVYAASGLSITPRTQISKIEALKEIRAWSLNPEEILKKQAMSTRHRTIASPEELISFESKISKTIHYSVNVFLIGKASLL